MKNIIILAAGPPKPNRERHTEINKNNGKIIIDDIIDKCTIENTKLYIVINPKVKKLINHIQKNHKNIEILYPEDEKIYSTLKTALSIKGDCILVSGDLINLQYGNINKFVDTEYKAAICKYKIRWGQNIIGTNYIRRSDIGDCTMLIGEKYKEYYLSNTNLKKAINYFKDFYPNKIINECVQNDIGTHLDYSFFFKIWSNENIDNFEDIGTIYFENIIYQDND
tara:strand:+ start:303 stop:974 length:672 start_codon:yes stop_codon:yes gene_type:complete